MPIRINLLEAEQKAKLARQRDPIMLTVRLSVLGVLLVVCVSVILFAYELALKAQLAGMESDWKPREPKIKTNEQDIVTLLKLVAKSDLVKAQVENRFLWGPQLELYKDVIPGTVQITRFVGRRLLETPAPAPGAKGPAPGPVEVVKVTLEGMAEGGRPELVVYEFLTQLKSSHRLAAQVEEIKLVSLTKGGAMAARTPEGGVAPEPNNARFVIEIQYKGRPLNRA
jgi:hypothetical protein